MGLYYYDKLKNLQEAKKWYKLAANQGFVNAIRKLKEIENANTQ